nr:spliceosome-associated protein 49 [Quercus suber]
MSESYELQRFYGCCGLRNSKGNLDERVSDRVLYDILIQAGRVIDLYIPRDKETDKPKGFAFAEYESAEVTIYQMCYPTSYARKRLLHKLLVLPDGIYNIKDHRARHSLEFGCHIWLLRRFLGVELLDK